MVTNNFYLASEEIANRCGVRQFRYKTKDGRYVLGRNDLSSIYLTSDELLHGLSGIEEVTKEEAQKAIEENNHTIELGNNIE